MIRETYADRHHHPPLIESAEILIAAVLMFGGWFAWYVGRERYFLTARQLAELAAYLIITGFTLVTTIALWATRRSRREKQWPHPPLAISGKRDERITQRAWSQNSVVLGYDIHGRPWYWPDRVRVMQAIVLGMTGTGKTTLLRNIISQDLARVVGPPDEPHRIPMVIFDGKGDWSSSGSSSRTCIVLAAYISCGLLNPARPDLSVRYNPFQCSDDEYMPVVAMIFGSFNLEKRILCEASTELPGGHRSRALLHGFEVQLLRRARHGYG